MEQTPNGAEVNNSEIVIEEIEHFDTDEVMAPANSRCQ
ncbi:hypothetical protein SPILM97S_00032 [Streptomyces pilosus]